MIISKAQQMRAFLPQVGQTQGSVAQGNARTQRCSRMGEKGRKRGAERKMRAHPALAATQNLCPWQGNKTLCSQGHVVSSNGGGGGKVNVEFGKEETCVYVRVCVCE